MVILIRSRLDFNFQYDFINIFNQNTFVRPARAHFYPELHLGQAKCLHADGRHRKIILGHDKGDAKLPRTQI